MPDGTKQVHLFLNMNKGIDNFVRMHYIVRESNKVIGLSRIRRAGTGLKAVVIIT
jgi:hypothetical protein